MMTPERLELYREIGGEIEEEANAIILRYRELFNEILTPIAKADSRRFDDSCLFVSFTKLGDEIEYEGDETWRYGGHEHYSMGLPARYLTGPWEDDVRATLRATLDAYEQGKREHAEVVRRTELARLAELQAKYQEAKSTDG